MIACIYTTYLFLQGVSGISQNWGSVRAVRKDAHAGLTPLIGTTSEHARTRTMQQEHEPLIKEEVGVCLPAIVSKTCNEMGL
jgi:hypothetical protein